MKLRDIALNSAFQTTKLVIPEWDNQEITLREMDARTRGLVLHLGASKEPSERAMLCRWLLADVAIACVYDSDGKPVFESAHRQTLADMPGGPLQRIFDAALTMSKISQSDLEVAEKN